MTTERALASFESGFSHPDFALTTEGTEAYEIACQAMREKIERENQEPLTFDELMNMKGEPVWLYNYGVSHWALVSGYMDYISLNGEKCKALAFIFETDDSYPIEILPFDTMGELWAAYRHKQKETC